MPVLIEIDESNDSAGEVVTHAIAAINAGTIDAPTLVPSEHPISAGENSFEKWLRWHFTSLGGAAAVDSLKAWSASPPAETELGFNGHEDQAVYDTENHVQLAFAAPEQTATRTPELLPTSEPTGPNIGIDGVLLGQLTDVGWSDYYLLQVRVGLLAQEGGGIAASFGYQVIA